MEEEARERAARKDVPHSVRLLQMDAADLKFAEAFDAGFFDAGAVVGFEPGKIAVAMTKAFLAVNGAQGGAGGLGSGLLGFNGQPGGSGDGVGGAISGSDAARRRKPVTMVSAEVKVWAGKASTLKPLPCGLDTRE